MTLSTDSKSDDRRQLRMRIRRERRALSGLQQRTASRKLCANVRSMRAFCRAKRIAVYLASDGEIDLQPLIELCWKLGKSVYLPVLHPVRHNRLWFTPYTAQTKLSHNRYRILEPQLKRPGAPAYALDMVLMPLVAFDSECNRMGMGGGYYDRTFAFTLARQGLKGPKLVGMAHDLQRVEKLSLADWDVPLKAVVTDQERYGTA